MTDTIDLLEAIGRDASLRHASTEELTNILEQAQASEALTSAVASGDSSWLSMELGNKPNQAPQVTQAPAREDDLEHEGEETPLSPSNPDHNKPMPPP